MEDRIKSYKIYWIGAYLMAHFLEDVIFGAGVGCLLGYGMQYGYDRWILKNDLKPMVP